MNEESVLLQYAKFPRTTPQGGQAKRIDPHASVENPVHHGVVGTLLNQPLLSFCCSCQALNFSRFASSVAG